MDAVEGWKQLSWSNKRFGISIGLMEGVQSKAAEYKSRFEECFQALDTARDDLTSAVSSESFAGEFLLLAAHTIPYRPNYLSDPAAAAER